MFTSVYFRLCLQLEDQLCTAKREKINLQTQIDDHLELMKETQRLHQSTLAARSVDATTIEAQTQEINELLKERDALRSQVDELQTKLSASDLKQVILYHAPLPTALSTALSKLLATIMVYFKVTVQAYSGQ